MNESVVLCEGYHDRAFWAGWLKAIGLKDPGESPDGNRKQVFDPWGKEVAKGHFGFQSSSGQFVRVVPCHGDRKKIKTTAANVWLDRAAKAWRQGSAEVRTGRLVLGVDSDVTVGADVELGLSPTSLLQWLQDFDANAEIVAAGDASLFGGATIVSLVRWTTDDPDVRGLPAKQTLERLVCAAIIAAYPRRGEPVHRWLNSRLEAPDAGPKEFAWSHMAGWYAESGCTRFYEELWENLAICEQLRQRLEKCGAWRVAQELAG
jgi:hypothetical protein